MRSHYNFSHTVTARSESFGRVDASTTSAAPDFSARGKALREAKERKERKVIDYAQLTEALAQMAPEAPEASDQ